MKTLIHFALLTGLLASPVVHAQERVYTLQVNEQNLPKIESAEGRPMRGMDLFAELQRQFPQALRAGEVVTEFRSVRLEAKSRVGGGQVNLQVVVGQEILHTDVQRIETDAATYNSDDGFQQVELFNSEAQVNGARLMILNPVRIRTLQVVLGPVKPVVVLGTYGGFSVAKIAGGQAEPTLQNVDPETQVFSLPETAPIPTPRPDPDTMVVTAPLVEAPPAEEPPRVTAPRVTNPPVVVTAPKPEPKKTVVNPAKGNSAACIEQLCVGSQVYHRRTYWQGVILKVNSQKKSTWVRFGVDGETFEAPVAARDLVLVPGP